MAGVCGGLGVRILQGGYFAFGTAIGAGIALVGLLWLDYFHSGISLTSELWAAMIGALIGGGISLAGQMLQNEHQRNEAEIDRNLSQLAIARSLFLTILEILGAIKPVRKHIERALANAAALAEKYLAVAVMDVAGGISVPRVPTEAKVLLMSSKFNDLFNLINQQDIYAQNLLDAFQINQIRRRELLALMDVEEITSGRRFSPLNGKETEVYARNAVLESDYRHLIIEFAKLEDNLAECLKRATKLIKTLGDDRFVFDFDGPT